MNDQDFDDLHLNVAGKTCHDLHRRLHVGPISLFNNHLLLRKENFGRVNVPSVEQVDFSCLCVEDWLVKILKFDCIRTPEVVTADKRKVVIRDNPWRNSSVNRR